MFFVFLSYLTVQGHHVVFLAKCTKFIIQSDLSVGQFIVAIKLHDFHSTNLFSHLITELDSKIVYREIQLRLEYRHKYRCRLLSSSSSSLLCTTGN